MSSNSKGVAAVTGATGFIAQVLIKQLFARGYTVHGTVRSLKSSKSTDLQSSFPSIKLFEADLLGAEQDFQKCFEGAKYVFHTASPFQLKVQDPQRDLVDPAVHGTEIAVNAALNTQSVQRIVLTSSVAAMLNDKSNGHVYTDKDWNTSSTLKTGPYSLSKTLAEKRAWELVGNYQKEQPEHKIDLVTIHPSFVLGPPINVNVESVSNSAILSFLNGEYADKPVPPVAMACVDVNDVAQAHIEAAERTTASGRYIVSSYKQYSYLEMNAILRQHFPDYPLATQESSQVDPKDRYFLETTRTANDLGIQFISIDQSLQSMTQKLVQLGLVKHTNKSN